MCLYRDYFVGHGTYFDDINIKSKNPRTLVRKGYVGVTLECLVCWLGCVKSYGVKLNPLNKTIFDVLQGNS